MLQKTEMSQASTNVDNKPTSIITSKNRQMYRMVKKNESIPANMMIHQISNDRLPNDLVHFQPTIINNIDWPVVYYLENDIKVCLKDNFYEISGLKGRKKYFSRRSQEKSELVYFYAEKLTKKINLLTIQRYFSQNNEKEELWYHLNLTKYEPATHQVQYQNYYIIGEQKSQTNSAMRQIWDFSSFKMIQNGKKGVIFFRILTKQPEITGNKYKIFLVDLQQKRKSIKTKLPEQSKLKILGTIDFDASKLGRQNDQIIKTIKSQFGDIILIITNRQIYELQIQEVSEGYKLYLKSYKMQKIINKKDIVLNKMTEKQSHNKDIKSHDANNNIDEEILDAEFMSNGLKIIILTNLHQMIVIDSHNYLFSQNIDHILLNSQFVQKYSFGNFAFTTIYSANGSICLEFKSKNDNDLLIPLQNSPAQKQNNSYQITTGLVILKMQSNSFSINKIFGLPFQYKEIVYHNISQCQGVDEIIIQYITKEDIYTLNVLKCKLLVSEINSFVRIDEEQYNYSKTLKVSNCQDLTQFRPIEEQKIYTSCSNTQASRFIYLLNGKELTCYKLFSEEDSQKIEKEKNQIFIHTFFERPIKISVSPLTMHFVIVFKEFVKFFYFNYTSIKNYFTLKIKNIVEAQYVLSGSKILIATLEGFVYLIDAYSFSQQKILQFYGEISEIKMVDEHHFILKSNKNQLILYERNWNEDSESRQFVKKYEVKVEDGDKYLIDTQMLLVVKKNFQMQVYRHDPYIIPSDLPETQRQIYQNLQENHKHLMNKQTGESSLPHEFPTDILLSNEIGFLFISTSKGNIKEYIWPLQEAINLGHSDVFIQQVSSQKIISIFMDARFTNLYAISQNGTFSQLKINQYINSELMPYIYIFNEKKKNDQKQKRQFTDKAYFIDNYTPTQLAISLNNQQKVQQLQFFIDKLKDDIQQMTKNALAKGQKESSVVKIQIKGKQKVFQTQLAKKKTDYMTQMTTLSRQRQLHQKIFTKEKETEQQLYQQQLLKIYKQAFRLKSIFKNQDIKLQSEKQHLIQMFQQILQKLNREKDGELIRLQREYQAIQERKLKIQKQNQIQEKEEQIQMEQYKKIIHQLIQKQYKNQQETKERFLGQNSKKQKAINNLKHRNSYFQNLILQTKVQISELLKDQVEYDNKKKYLKQELKDKEQIIQKIQKQLVIYLKNTQDMKTIKNNHEFQLDQYEKQVNPIQDNYKHLEDNVKNMNVQIMLQYNHKVNKIDSIESKQEYIVKLKEKKKLCVDKKLEKENKFNRLAQKLTYLAKNTFDIDIKYQLFHLFEKNDKSDELIRLDQQKQKQKRSGVKLLRHKNMIRKEIEEEQKREQHIIKNQHQFYRYHNENTTLVRQFNELKKTQKILEDQQKKMEQKVEFLKMTRLKTPLKRIPSKSMINNHEKKMTPFQRYEQLNSIVNFKKNQDTADTRLSKNSQSVSFLKGLMKQVNQTDNKYEKMELMKERVRTFVNPQFKSRNQDIKKLIYNKTRGISEKLMLK